MSRNSTIKTTPRDVKEKLNKYNNTSCSWTGSLYFLLLVFIKSIYTISAIPTKTQIVHFIETERLILHFTWKCKQTRTVTVICQRITKLKDLYYLISGFSIENIPVKSNTDAKTETRLNKMKKEEKQLNF